MTDQRKQRSTSWIVAVHVVTAGAVMPWLGNFAGVAMALILGLTPSESFLASLAAQTLGYVAGASLSLFYLRNFAFHPDPKQCIVPAVVAFVVLAVVAAGANLTFVWDNQSFYGPLFLLVFAATPIYYLIVTFLLAKVTERGFRALAVKGDESLGDQSAELKVFGVLQIVLGVVCAALASRVLLSAMPMLRAGHGGTIISLKTVIAIAPFLEMAIAFVWLGIGSIRARRWARDLTVVLSWLWLLAGVRFSIMFFFLAGPTMQLSGAEEAGILPPTMMTKRFALVAAVNGCLYFLLPAMFLLFYQRASVRATCRRRDPQTRWTDHCPLPVLAVSVVHAYYAVSMPSAALGRCVVPLFGVLISGARGAAALLLTALLLVWLAWGVYRLKTAAWWGTLLLWILWGVSNAATFWRVHATEMYEKRGLSAAQLEIVRRTGIAERMASWSFWVVPLTMIVALAYLIYLRRYFRKGRNAA